MYWERQNWLLRALKMMQDNFCPEPANIPIIPLEWRCNQSTYIYTQKIFPGILIHIPLLRNPTCCCFTKLLQVAAYNTFTCKFTFHTLILNRIAFKFLDNLFSVWLPLHISVLSVADMSHSFITFTYAYVQQLHGT